MTSALRWISLVAHLVACSSPGVRERDTEPSDAGANGEAAIDGENRDAAEPDDADMGRDGEQRDAAQPRLDGECAPRSLDASAPEYDPGSGRELSFCGRAGVALDAGRECLIPPCAGPFEPRSPILPPECPDWSCRIWQFHVWLETEIRARARDGQIVSLCGGNMAPLAELLSRYPGVCVLMEPDQVAREATSDELSFEAQCRSGQLQRNLNDLVQLRVPPEYPPDVALTVLAELEALDAVEAARLGCADIVPPGDPPR